MKKFTFICILQLIVWLPSSSAQENPFIFSQLKEENGLSDNIINCFLKDSRGILWIGTYNGFNRFDGTNFTVYKKRKHTNSMLNEVVHKLCEDKQGNIWGSTDKGVFCYKPSTDSFINYSIKSNGTGNNFYNIISDKSGTIWAGGEWSLFKFMPALNKFDEAVKLSPAGDSLNLYRIRKNGLVADPSGNGLWMATASGIVYYDSKQQRIQNHRSHPGDSLFARRSVSALAASPFGHFWFYNHTQKQLVSFDPQTKKILKRIDIGEAMPNANGASIFEDAAHRLWFSSWTYELLLIDQKNNNNILFLKHRPGDNRSIASQFFWAAFQDDDKTIWLGTPSGISRCNPEKDLYREMGLPTKIKELAGTSIVLAEADPSDNSLWILTKSHSLIHYNRSANNYVSIELGKTMKNEAGFMPGSFNHIRFMPDRIVIGTSAGSWQIKRGAHHITRFDHLPAGYENFLCAEVLPVGDSIIYYNNGKELLYWNKKNNVAGLLKFRQGEINANDKRTVISGIMMGPGNKLWAISTDGHIVHSNPGNNLTRIRIIKDPVKESGAFINIAHDKQDNIWVLNKGVGLYKYNPFTKETKFWDETDGLAGSRIQKLKPDAAGRIWTTLYNKVCIFLPAAQSFYNFKVPISESDLNYYNHVSILPNGNIFASIGNEIVEFFPDRLMAVPGNRKPEISRLTSIRKEINLMHAEPVVLQPDDNTLRFHFGLLTDNSIFPFDMEYMLEGVQSTWTKSNRTNEALYNNLPAGKFTFKVRAVGNNNVWQSQEASYSFKIKAPFYKTTWFLLLMVAMLATLLYSIYRYRLFQKQQVLQLENKAQALEKEKAMVMYENLKQQLNPHFLFNSLSSLSGLIETDQQLAGNFLEHMSGIYRYILQNSERETVSLKDEIEFVHLYVQLQQTRFVKGLQVHVNVPEEFYHYKIAPVTLQNLVENAIKHNVIDDSSPLVIDIYVEDDEYIVVKNNLQRKNVVETSNKRGLTQFISFYKYLTDQPVKIDETEQYFKISIPLI